MISLHDSVLGGYINMSSAVLRSNILNIVCFSFLSGSTRSMCPSHYSLFPLIHFTILNVYHFSDASCWGVLRVSSIATSTSKRHSSKPYPGALLSQKCLPHTPCKVICVCAFVHCVTVYTVKISVNLKINTGFDIASDQVIVLS